jgi:hypothetical protein
MKNVGKFYGHLKYLMTIWYILWSFGTFYGRLIYFIVLWHILLPSDIFYGPLVCFKALCHILRPFGAFNSPLVYFMVLWHMYFIGLWYILRSFVFLHQEKSGNPATGYILSATFWSRLERN